MPSLLRPRRNCVGQGMAREQVSSQHGRCHETGVWPSWHFPFLRTFLRVGAHSCVVTGARESYMHRKEPPGSQGEQPHPNRYHAAHAQGDRPRTRCSLLFLNLGQHDLGSLSRSSPQSIAWPRGMCKLIRSFSPATSARIYPTYEDVRGVGGLLFTVRAAPFLLVCRPGW